MPGHPQRVVLTPTGLVGERWNAQTRVVDRERVDDSIPWLRVEVALEGEVTLGALFRIVGSYPELMDFLARYAWCGGLRAFHAAALEVGPMAPERAREGWADAIVSLELYRLIAITPMGVESGVYFHGLGAPDAPDADGVALPYNIGFAPPMDELAPLPLRVRPTSDIRDERTPAAGGDSFGVLPARYTLLELLDAISFELSFHGQTPRARDETAARLLAGVEGGPNRSAEEPRT